jgi:arylsulfatase
MKHLFFILLALLVLSCCNPAEESRDPNAPNIILVITDDQGYGDLGIHGNPFVRTPVLDSLAGISTRIDPFYVSPVCAPTRSSLMTGRYHLRTGVYDTYNGGALMAPGEHTLAEVLAEHGYRTGMVGKWHLGDSYPMRPMDQGFQYYLAHKGGGIGQPGDDIGNYLRTDSSYFDPYLWENGKRVRRYGYCSDIFTDQAITFIREHHAHRPEAPFFLYLSYNAPHTPLQLPETYYKPFRDMKYGSGDFSVSGKNVSEMSDRDMEDARRVYGMISNLDDNLGRLLLSLKELSLEEQTLLVFMTDNGPQQRRYTAGLNQRKSSVMEGGIRVPCMFYWKGKLREDQLISTPSAHIDIMPTLLEFAGIDYAGDMDGVSLYPLLTGQGEGPEERPLFFVWERGYPQRYSNMAVRKGHFKLVGQDMHGASPDQLLLFDLENDPFELVDVSQQYPELKSGLIGEMDQWYEEIIVSPHLVEPPRIIVGSEHENQVVLGRNDWKGPTAMRWSSPEAFGYWDISVEDPGPYRVTLVFQGALPADGVAWVRAGTRQYGVNPEGPGNHEITLDDLVFDRGEHSFEGWFQTGGRIISPLCIEIVKSIDQ